MDRDRTRIRPARLVAAIADLREFAGRVSAGERNRPRCIHNYRARSAAVEAKLRVAIVGHQRDIVGGDGGGPTGAAHGDITRSIRSTDQNAAAIVSINARVGELGGIDRASVPAGHNRDITARLNGGLEIDVAFREQDNISAH